MLFLRCSRIATTWPLCWPGTSFPDLRDVPNVPNDVPNISGHVGDIVRWTLYGGHRTVDIVRWTLYVGHCTFDIVLNLAIYPAAALDVTVQNQNQN